MNTRILQRAGALIAPLALTLALGNTALAQTTEGSPAEAHFHLTALHHTHGQDHSRVHAAEADAARHQTMLEAEGGRANKDNRAIALHSAAFFHAMRRAHEAHRGLGRAPAAATPRHAMPVRTR